MNGSFVATGDPASSDVWISGPSCPGAFADGNPYTLHFRYGYQALDALKGFATYTSVGTFASAGTSILYTDLLAPRGLVTYGTLQVATANTDVKMRITGVQGGGIATLDALTLAASSGIYPY